MGILKWEVGFPLTTKREKYWT